MKIRIKTKGRVANDNADAHANAVISLRDRRARAARRGALMRDWAPAILATFFGGGSRDPP
jgi:hypothetical protein